MKILLIFFSLLFFHYSALARDRCKTSFSWSSLLHFALCAKAKSFVENKKESHFLFLITFDIGKKESSSHLLSENYYRRKLIEKRQENEAREKLGLYYSKSFGWREKRINKSRSLLTKFLQCSVEFFFFKMSLLQQSQSCHKLFSIRNAF